MLVETLDNWLDSLGERINPILVKETRQALKSRQFSVTFMLLLAASLIVSFGGVALSAARLSFRSAGNSFFIAYFVVLAFAVFVIVPFGAYRSLATEQEERTFELISITKLNPRQIVAGKLLSALIQMIIYFSAIGPCMTFTLLLKGIDAPSIALVLSLSALASTGLSMVGLLLASMTRRRGWHIFVSVALITSLLIAMVICVGIATGVIQFVAPQMRTVEFWTGMACGLTVFVTYFVLAFQLSAAHLTFESDNRSTRVRLTLAIQFVLCLGWMAYWWIGYGRGDLRNLIITAILVAIHWFVVGTLLIGESAGISERVAREIPRRTWRQMLLAFLLPGPDTGFAFLLMNMICFVAMLGLGEWTLDWVWPGASVAATGGRHNTTLFALSLASYIILYCGLGKAVAGLIRRRRPAPALACAAVTWIMAALGSAVPAFFALVLPYHQYQTYRIWQISDPIATLLEVYRMTRTLSLAFIPAGLAAIVVLLNLRSMTMVVSQIRLAAESPKPARREVR